MGKFLAKNKKYSDIISNELKDETVEGAELLIDLNSFFSSYVFEHRLPILKNLLTTICNNQKLDIPWSELNIH